MKTKKQTVKIKSTSLPTKGSEYSAGYDVVSTEHASICPGARMLISTGLHIEPPDNVFALLLPRSGLATKHGVATTIGTIDNDYRGEIKANLVNFSNATFTINPGDRIAQLVFLESPDLELKLADKLTETDRGDKGFGSTGV